MRGAGAKWGVYLPRLRLLLGEIAARPARRDCEAADEHGEVPQRPPSDEGMDTESALPQVERIVGGAAAQAVGLPELLWCDREFKHAFPLRLRSDAVALQAAKPPQSEPRDDMGAVHASSARLGCAAAKSGGGSAE